MLGDCATNFLSMFSAGSNTSISGSMNSATKSARTCSFMEVRGMYLMSKAPRIVSHLAILLV